MAESPQRQWRRGLYTFILCQTQPIMHTHHTHSHSPTNTFLRGCDRKLKDEHKVIWTVSCSFYSRCDVCSEMRLGDVGACFQADGEITSCLCSRKGCLYTQDIRTSFTHVCSFESKFLNVYLNLLSQKLVMTFSYLQWPDATFLYVLISTHLTFLLPLVISY